MPHRVLSIKINKNELFPKVLMFIRKKKISKISDLRQGSAIIH